MLSNLPLLLSNQCLVAHKRYLQILRAIHPIGARRQPQRNSDARRYLRVTNEVHLPGLPGMPVGYLPINGIAGFHHTKLTLSRNFQQLNRTPLLPHLPRLHYHSIISRLQPLVLHLRYRGLLTRSPRMLLHYFLVLLNAVFIRHARHDGAANAISWLVMVVVTLHFDERLLFCS